MSLFIKPSQNEPPLMPSMPPPPETPPPPLALAHLVTPAQAAPPAPPPEPPPGSPLVLQPPPPKPVSKARAAAALAYARAMGDEGGREALLVAPAEPYDLPPPMLESELASLQAAVSEVTLEGEIGRLTLVHAYSPEGTDRPELTFRDAAHLRTLVQIFPGARVVAIKKPPVPSDAAEPPVDPLDLGEDTFDPALLLGDVASAEGASPSAVRSPQSVASAEGASPSAVRSPQSVASAEGASPSAVEPDPFEGFEEDPFA